MKLRIIVPIFFVLYMTISNCIAQSNEKIAEVTLDYLNEELSWNLQNRNNSILVVFGSQYYISTQFVQSDSLPFVRRIWYQFEVIKLEDKQFEFIFKSPVGEGTDMKYSGSFKLQEVEGVVRIYDLQYSHFIK